MVEESRPPETHEVHATVHYERTDASHRWIIGILGAAVVIGVLILAGLWLVFARYRDYQAEVKKSPFPLAPKLAPKPPPNSPPDPRLEELDRLSGLTRSDAVRVAAAREAGLNSYGPTAEEWFIHIPIDWAIRLLENKLPVRAEAPDDRGKGNGLVDAGEPNSGRMLKRSSR
jgi:hypothetical protein